MYKIGECIENFDTNDHNRQVILLFLNELKKISFEAKCLYVKKCNGLSIFVGLYESFLNNIFECNCCIAKINKININNNTKEFAELCKTVEYDVLWKETQKSYKLLKEFINQRESFLTKTEKYLKL